MKFNFANSSRPPAEMAPAPGMEDDEFFDEEELEESSVEDILRDSMPWIIAVLFHAALLLITLLIVYRSDPPLEEEPVSPQAVEDKNVDIKPPEPEVVVETEVTEAPAPFSPTPTPTPTPSPSVVVAAPAMPGTTFAGGSPGGSPFNGVGTGQTNGMFGGGGGGGNPTDTLFVIDATGSLVDTLDFVKKEIRRYLNAEMPDSGSEGGQFGIIFFSGAEYNGAVRGSSNGISRFNQQMVPITPKNVEDAYTWMEQIEPGGTTNPLNAIDMGIDMNPERIIILSDNITGKGKWEIQQDTFIDSVMDSLDDAGMSKPGSGFALECFQYIYNDPLVDFGGQPTLQLLVEEFYSAIGEPADGRYIFHGRDKIGIR